MGGRKVIGRLVKSRHGIKWKVGDMGVGKKKEARTTGKGIQQGIPII